MVKAEVTYFQANTVCTGCQIIKIIARSGLEIELQKTADSTSLVLLQPKKKGNTIFISLIFDIRCEVLSPSSSFLL